MPDLDNIDIESLAKEAVKYFWLSRNLQAKKQKKTGKKDQGSRGAVTGGAQMNGFISIFENIAGMAGVPPESIFARNRFLELPGYFRPTKEWDFLVVHKGILLAAIEAKSQVGPSFGNNFNNRTEEAMGSAFDLWTAFRENAFTHPVRPWLGYLFLLEDCDRSRSPVKVREPHFSVFPEFVNASYAQRYQLFCKKLFVERSYDASALILSGKDSGLQGHYSEPDDGLSIRRFFKSFASHLKGNL